MPETAIPSGALAQAIAAALCGVEYSHPAAVAFAWAPYFDRTELSKLRVSVMPGSEELARQSRAGVAFLATDAAVVAVQLAATPAPADAAKIAAVMRVAEEIKTALRAEANAILDGRKFQTLAHGVAGQTLIDPRMLREKEIATTAILATYQSFR